MPDEELRIVVRIKDKANKILGRLRKSLRGIGKIAKIGAVALTAMGVAVGLMGAKMVGLANEQEKVETKLRTVIKSMTKFRESADTLVPRLLDTASALQQVGIAGDEAILAGTTLLTTYKEIGDEELPRAMEVMTDLSALMGGDMTNAANTLGKAAIGMTGELRRAGITLDDSVAKSGDFSLILEAISEQIGAQNAALRRTGFGGLVAFNNEMGDLQETGGKVIKGVLGPIAEAAARSLGKLNIQLNEFVESERFKEWAKEAIPIIAAGFNIIIKVIGKAVQAGLAFLGTMVEIAKAYKSLSLGIQSNADDTMRKEQELLMARRESFNYWQGLTLQEKLTMDPPTWSEKDVVRLKQIGGELDANLDRMRNLQGSIRDSEKFIGNLADASFVTGAAFDNLGEDFMRNVDDIVANLDQIDLLGGGPGGGAPPPGAPDSKEAQGAMDKLTQVYRDAQLDIIEINQGTAQRALGEFDERMTELSALADQAMAQGILTKERWQEMESTIQQAHDLRMEEMNRTHWQQILADTEANLALANSTIEEFGQGSTDAMAGWMADMVLGIKGASGRMLEAMGGLIGGIAQQWGEYYVLKGIASIAEAFTTFPAVNTGMLGAGLKLIAAGTALKALGSVIGKGAQVGGVGGDAGGGGGVGAGAGGGLPGQGTQEPGRDTLIVLDVGELSEEDIITDVPAFMTVVIDNLNDAFGRNVTVQTIGGEE
jgi:hypothetical protein